MLHSSLSIDMQDKVSNHFAGGHKIFTAYRLTLLFRCFMWLLKVFANASLVPTCELRFGYNGFLNNLLTVML